MMKFTYASFDNPHQLPVAELGASCFHPAVEANKSLKRHLVCHIRWAEWRGGKRSIREGFWAIIAVGRWEAATPA